MGKIMKRRILDILTAWADQTEHMPLLLRGARQVGKTFVIEQFAKLYFKGFININFELEPEYKGCFESLKPIDIINAIQGLKGDMIEAGSTLLFLDEIQDCPRAIMALRYFKEQMPDLHVIGAGSLLEFALQNEDFTMPVGRVQYLYLKPLSFQEFLEALNFKSLLETLQSCTLAEPPPPVIHEKLLSLVREYLITGGMPAAVQTYLDTKNFLQTQRIQTVIMSTYRNDFGKYAKQSHHKYLEKVFTRAPGIIGQEIKYSKIDPEMRSRDLKQAIRDLNHMAVLHSVFASSASGLPLSALVNEKKFKLLFLDVGLINRAAGIATNEILSEEITLVNKGAIAEQFVGQELLAYQDYYEEAKIFFWTREVKGSLAEVDYLMNINSRIVPIEVKAGKTGHLKSLLGMLEEKKLPMGVRVSELPLQLNQSILSIPFYLIGELERLLGLVFS
jgi:predicted AAA+ superfamily ATPase